MIDQERFTCRLYPVPESTIDPREAVLTGIETAPRDLITGVNVNPAARDLLPASLKYLATEDFLASHVLLTVPTETAQRRIINPFHFGRSLPIAFGIMPFELGVGRVLTGKGSWIGGDVPERYKRRYLDPNTHYGLLSTDGAREDTIISTQLLAGGFRSALHTGYVVFHETKLHDWIAEKWKQKIRRNFIDHCFALAALGGGPAYLYRIGATTERCDPQILDRKAPRKRKTEIRRAAQCILCEEALPNSHVAQALRKFDKPSQRTILGSFNHIVQNIPLDTAQEQAIFQFVCAMFGQNATGIIAANKQLESLKLKGNYVSSNKDVDLGLFSYDYDAAQYRDMPSDPSENKELYIEQVEQVVFDYMECIIDYQLDTRVYRPMVDRISDIISQYA